MLDIDHLEEIAKMGDSVCVSSGWLRAVLGEVRGNRTKIAELEAKVRSLETKKSIPEPEVQSDVKSATDFFDQGWDSFDRGFDAMARVFRGKKKS